MGIDQDCSGQNRAASCLPITQQVVGTRDWGQNLSLTFSLRCPKPLAGLAGMRLVCPCWWACSQRLLVVWVRSGGCPAMMIQGHRGAREIAPRSAVPCGHAAVFDVHFPEGARGTRQA